MSVRLLFDENLSPTLVRDLADIFPESAHVRDLRLQSAPDEEIWRRAAADGFIIVTKDDDFRQRSFLYGFPPNFPRPSTATQSAACPRAALGGQSAHCASDTACWRAANAHATIHRFSGTARCGNRSLHA